MFIYDNQFFNHLQIEDDIDEVKKRNTQTEPYVIFQDVKDHLYFSTIVIDGRNFTVGYVSSQRAFDLLYKSYYVFNLKFEQSNRHIFNFFESSVYGIKTIAPSIISHKFNQYLMQ